MLRPVRGQDKKNHRLFPQAIHFVQESDLVVVLPARVCGPTLRTVGLSALPLPLDGDLCPHSGTSR